MSLLNLSQQAECFDVPNSKLLSVPCIIASLISKSLIVNPFYDGKFYPSYHPILVSLNLIPMENILTIKLYYISVITFCLKEYKIKMEILTHLLFVFKFGWFFRNCPSDFLFFVLSKIRNVWFPSQNLNFSIMQPSFFVLTVGMILNGTLSVFYTDTNMS